nr:hypothetical protein [Tanacetum cinerariifolium]
PRVLVLAGVSGIVFVVVEKREDWGDSGVAGWRENRVVNSGSLKTWEGDRVLFGLLHN